MPIKNKEITVMSVFPVYTYTAVGDNLIEKW